MRSAAEHGITLVWTSLINNLQPCNILYNILNVDLNILNMTTGQH